MVAPLHAEVLALLQVSASWLSLAVDGHVGKAETTFVLDVTFDAAACIRAHWPIISGLDRLVPPWLDGWPSI